MQADVCVIVMLCIGIIFIIICHENGIYLNCFSCDVIYVTRGLKNFEYCAAFKVPKVPQGLKSVSREFFVVVFKNI